MMTESEEKILRDWVAALRSGKYQQGQKGLRTCDGNKFCCLGVLADLVDPDGWAEENETELPGGMRWKNAGSGVIWPDDVGLSYDAVGDDKFSRLIYMNDNGVGFDEIADYIEEWYDAKPR